jgi:hypothetical protein
MISFNESDPNPTCVRYDRRDIHGEWVDPFGIYREHVYDEVGGTVYNQVSQKR